MQLREYTKAGWKPARDVGTMPLSDVVYPLNGKANHTFSTLFPIYDWKDDRGYDNLGQWIEAAAGQAGR
jgi:hypothetical protein